MKLKYKLKVFPGHLVLRAATGGNLTTEKKIGNLPNGVPFH